MILDKLLFAADVPYALLPSNVQTTFDFYLGNGTYLCVYVCACVLVRMRLRVVRVCACVCACVFVCMIVISPWLLGH